jgi:hypothetical protein
LFTVLTEVPFFAAYKIEREAFARAFAYTIQTFLFELGEKLTNLTFQPEAIEKSNLSAFRPTRIEIFVLYGKVSDSSGFYIWPI